jgi:hypothetical protein
MTRRSWLYGLLKNDSVLHSFHGGQVFQSSGMTTANLKKPYLVYHIGNDTSEQLAEDHPAHRIFFQVYIHDEPGDYQKIDDIGDRVKVLLLGQGSPSNQIINTRFLECSQDLSDETLRTIFRYLRFQWILGR